MKTALYDYYIIDRTHRELRKKCEHDLGAEYSALGLCGEERMTRRFEYLSSLETPHIHKDEKIVGESPWEKLPYNTLAGAKYASVGREFKL